MTHINLSDLDGVLLLEKLTHYMQEHADISKPYRMTNPVAISQELQRGETCKLLSLSTAMGQVAGHHGVFFPPLYKGKRSAGPSLREIAKGHGSKVGEMYSVQSLVETCKDAGFESRIYEPTNEDQYIEQLISSVNDNHTPIVFFDMNSSWSLRYGLPQIGTGENEHAAVVVGYYKTEWDETRFIVTHSNKYFDFDAKELALSACYSLTEMREAETFVKVRSQEGITQWILKEKSLRLGETLVATAGERRVTETSGAEDSLQSKILVVTKPRILEDSETSEVEWDMCDAPEERKAICSIS